MFTTDSSLLAERCTTTPSQDVDQPSDEEIVRRYQQQSQAAESQALLNELFQRHYRRVCAWCYCFTQDHEASLDLAQEALLSAFRNIYDFRGECKFSTWLYKIVRNQCFKEKKEQKHNYVQTSKALLEKRADVSADPYTRLEQRSRRKLGQQLLRESLTDTERCVMTLHFAQEMTLEEVSRRLHLVNASGARAFLVSAKRKLTRAGARPAASAGASV
jgi:RNA polymerase sigma-70 factor (ECF subfamily)